MKKLFGLFLCVLFVFASCKMKEKPGAKQEVPKVKSALAKIETMRTKSASGVRGFMISEKAKTAILVLPIDHDFVLTSIKPTITISKGASISPATDVEQDFSSGKTVSYTVTAENGEKNTYVASVKVLGPRGNLNVDSIFICGEKVVSDAVTVPAQYSFVEKKDIKVNFTGDNVPISFGMSEEKVILNKKGESKSVILSTAQTDEWNAWTSSAITITRGDSEAPPSNEKKILDFYISFNVDDDEGTITNKSNVKCNIDEENKKISYTLPVGSMYETIKTNIRCSTGALLICPEGTIDFKKSMATPIIYTVKAADRSTQTYSVSIDRAKSSKAKIKSFSVVGDGASFVGKIDEDAKTIFVGVRRDLVDITGIKPKIRLSADATVSPSANEAQDFTNSMSSPVIYNVKAEDGVTVRAYSVSIRHLSIEADITSFSLKVGNVDRPCIITGTDIRLPAPLPRGTDVRSLVATVGISAGAKVTPSSGSSRNFTKPVEYTVLAEDKFTKKVYTVTVEVEKSHEAKILEFSIDDEKGVIDEALGTIVVRMPEDKDVTALKPKIKISDGAKVEPASDVSQDFTNPVPYKVTAEDGTTKRTYTVTVRKGKSSEARIIGFSIDGVGGNIDEGAKKILVDLPAGHALDNLTPKVKVSDGATYTPKGAQNFTNSVTKPIEYTVTAENGTNRAVYNVSVRSVSDEAEIKTFSIDGKNAKTITHPSGSVHGKVLVVLLTGHALDNLTPTVKVSDGATYTPKGAQNFTNSVTKPIEYTVTAENGTNEAIYDVIVRHIFDEAKIKGFSIDGTDAKTIEHPSGSINGKILVVLPTGKPLDNLTPEVRVSDGADYDPKGSQHFSDSVSNPIEYIVTAENGTNEAKYDVTVRHIFNEAEIKAFSIGDQSAKTITHPTGSAHGKVLVVLSAGHALDNLTPEVTVSAGATYTPTGAQNFTNSVTKPIEYTVTAENGTNKAIYDVSVRCISSEAKIKEFSVGDAKASIDESAHTISVVVLDDVDITSVVPTIVVSKYATVSPTEAQNFSGGSTVSYTVTAEDNTQVTYNATVMKKPKSYKCVVHGKEVTLKGGGGDDAYVVELPNTVTSLAVDNIKAYFVLTNSTEKEVPQNKMTMSVKEGDITQSNATVKIELQIAQFEDFVSKLIKIEITKKDP